MITWISIIGFLGAMVNTSVIGADKPSSSTEVAIFSGGCFWCEAEAFNKLPGVLSVVSGYTGGHTIDPTYAQVSAEGTGHKESIQVTFDPTQITYDQLLDVYWHNIDPFDGKGQFCDKGDSYKALIFYTNDIQKHKAEASKKKLEAMLKQPILTEIQAASFFYPAEDYHQDYAQKNPIRYKFYRYACGRDKRLAEIWGKK